MISIRESVAELERIERLRLDTLECYKGAIQSAAQYAVVLEDSTTATHQKHLEALAAEVAGDRPDCLRQAQGTLRALLREYREKGKEFIGNLRKELANTAAALQQIMETMAQSDGEHDLRMGASVKRLKEVSFSDRCGSAGPVLQEIAHAVERAVEDMRKQHRLTVSQFQVEIRMLHQRIDSLERTASLDAMSQLLNRAEMEAQILASGSSNFSLLLLRTQGIQAAERRFDADVANQLAAAFGKRLRNCMPAGAVLGNWGDEQYVALAEFPKRDAVQAARRVVADLSGAYSCLLEGKTVHPALLVGVGVVDREAGEAPERVLARLREFFSK
jgi:GGDEF domain-containing protein